MPGDESTQLGEKRRVTINLSISENRACANKPEVPGRDFRMNEKEDEFKLHTKINATNRQSSQPYLAYNIKYSRVGCWDALLFCYMQVEAVVNPLIHYLLKLCGCSTIIIPYSVESGKLKAEKSKIK